MTPTTQGVTIRRAVGTTPPADQDVGRPRRRQGRPGHQPRRHRPRPRARRTPTRCSPMTRCPTTRPPPPGRARTGAATTADWGAVAPRRRAPRAGRRARPRSRRRNAAGVDEEWNVEGGGTPVIAGGVAYVLSTSTLNGTGLLSAYQLSTAPAAVADLDRLLQRGRRSRSPTTWWCWAAAPSRAPTPAEARTNSSGTPRRRRRGRRVCRTCSCIGDRVVAWGSTRVASYQLSDGGRAWNLLLPSGAEHDPRRRGVRVDRRGRLRRPVAGAVADERLPAVEQVRGRHPAAGRRGRLDLHEQRDGIRPLRPGRRRRRVVEAGDVHLRPGRGGRRRHRLRVGPAVRLRTAIALGAACPQHAATARCAGSTTCRRGSGRWRHGRRALADLDRHLQPGPQRRPHRAQPRQRRRAEAHPLRGQHLRLDRHRVRRRQGRAGPGRQLRRLDAAHPARLRAGRAGPDGHHQGAAGRTGRDRRTPSTWRASSAPRPGVCSRGHYPAGSPSRGPGSLTGTPTTATSVRDDAAGDRAERTHGRPSHHAPGGPGRLVGRVDDDRQRRERQPVRLRHRTARPRGRYRPCPSAGRPPLPERL